MAEVEAVNAVILTMNGKDEQWEREFLDVDLETPDSEILDKIEPLINEQGHSLKENDEYNYGVRKATNSGNIYIFPKVTAGCMK
jgi:hypothetical protein